MSGGWGYGDKLLLVEKWPVVTLMVLSRKAARLEEQRQSERQDGLSPDCHHLVRVERARAQVLWFLGGDGMPGCRLHFSSSATLTSLWRQMEDVNTASSFTSCGDLHSSHVCEWGGLYPPPKES